MVKIAEEKKSRIVDLRKGGHAYGSIAEKVGVSSKTAHKYGKGVRMNEDRRYNRGRVKELVRTESKKLIRAEQIKPSHREEFDRLISEQVDSAIKGLAQGFGLGSSPFVGLFGAGRSIANIAFEAEESEKYTVLPVLKNFLFGVQKLPVIPLRRKLFAKRIAKGLIGLNWDKIKDMLIERKPKSYPSGKGG